MFVANAVVVGHSGEFLHFGRDTDAAKPVKGEMAGARMMQAMFASVPEEHLAVVMIEYADKTGLDKL